MKKFLLEIIAELFPIILLVIYLVLVFTKSLNQKGMLICAFGVMLAGPIIQKELKKRL